MELPSAASAMDFETRRFLQDIGWNKCVFCHSVQGKHSKVLSCIHLACKSCALADISFQNTITCTRCHRVVKNPGHGYNVVDSLVDWPDDGIDAADPIPEASAEQQSSEALKSGAKKRRRRPKLRSASSSSTEFQASVAHNRLPICEDEACQDSDVPATSRCMECNMTLCEGHVLVHGKGKITSTHNILPLEGVADGNDLKCRLHSSKDLIKYCSTCNICVCVICLAKDAHGGHDLEEISTAAKRFKGEFETNLAEIKGGDVGTNRVNLLTGKQAVVKAQLDKIAEEHSALSVQISDDFQTFPAGLARREALLKEAVDQKHWKVSKQLEKIAEHTRELYGQVMVSQRLVSSLNDVSLLRASEPIRLAMKQSIADAKLRVPACSLDTKYHGFSSFVKDLGSLSSMGAQDNPIYCLQFDAKSMMAGIELSNNSQIASTTVECNKKKNPDGSTYVERLGICGAHGYSSGVIQFRLQLLENAANQYVGVSSMSQPLSGLNRGFLGWGGHEGIANETKGGCLGLPWRNKDILSLTLDCTQSKLTALHERTGETETITVYKASGLLYFQVLLSPVGSVRILPVIFT